VLSSRKESELEQLARSLPGGVERHAVVVADLADEGAAQQVVRDAGDLDGLIANAALPGVGSIEKVEAEVLTRTRSVRVSTSASTFSIDPTPGSAALAIRPSRVAGVPDDLLGRALVGKVCDHNGVALHPAG